jgi:hypothetical protein
VGSGRRELEGERQSFQVDAQRGDRFVIALPTAA